jgi:hypothetical protein
MPLVRIVLITVLVAAGFGVVFLLSIAAGMALVHQVTYHG